MLFAACPRQAATLTEALRRLLTQAEALRRLLTQAAGAAKPRRTGSDPIWCIALRATTPS